MGHLMDFHSVSKSALCQQVSEQYKRFVVQLLLFVVVAAAAAAAFAVPLNSRIVVLASSGF